MFIQVQYLNENGRINGQIIIFIERIKNMKKLTNMVTKFIVITVLFTTVMLFLGVNGQAYIDPAVTTYLIQAVAGVVVAIGAVAGIYFRKAKKKINDKLGIDENKNKEVESDEI